MRCSDARDFTPYWLKLQIPLWRFTAFDFKLSVAQKFSRPFPAQSSFQHSFNRKYPSPPFTFSSNLFVIALFYIFEEFAAEWTGISLI
jgi:hypothetical protein